MRRWILALALVGCAPDEPPPLDVTSLEATLEPLRVEPNGWSTRGELSFSVTAGKGSQPNRAVVTRVSLSVCAGDIDDELTATAFTTLGLRVEPRQSMPLEVAPASSRRASFDFDGGRTTPVLPPGWDSWCVTSAPRCQVAEAMLYVEVTDRLVDDVKERGRDQLALTVPLVVDDGRDLEPDPQPVGALWSRVVPEADPSTVGPVAVDELGRVTFFSGATLHALDPDGASSWTETLVASVLWRELLARGDEVVAVGIAVGDTSLYGEELTDGDLVVARLSAMDGSPLRVDAVPGPGQPTVEDAALAPDGSVVALVDVPEPTDWGGGPLEAGVVLARWTSDGTLVHGQVIAPSPASPFGPERIALTGTGDVVVVGPLNDAFDFGQGLVEPSALERPLAVARYDATGALVLATSPAMGGSIVGMATDGMGRVHLALGAFASAVVGTIDDQGELTGVLSYPGSGRASFVPGGFAVDAAGRPLIVDGPALVLPREDGLEATRISCSGGFVVANGPTGEIGIVGSVDDVVSFDQGPISVDEPAVVAARLRDLP